jgi:hypothetical protein
MRNLFPALPVSFRGVFWLANREWLWVCNLFILWLYQLTQYTYESLLSKIQLIQGRFGLCSPDPLLEKPDMTDGKQQKIFSDISLPNSSWIIPNYLATFQVNLCRTHLTTAVISLEFLLPLCSLPLTGRAAVNDPGYMSCPTQLMKYNSPMYLSNSRVNRWIACPRTSHIYHCNVAFLRVEEMQALPSHFYDSTRWESG